MSVSARPIYESDLPWDSERPDTVLITCVDGRWYHHFQEFARQQLKAGSRTDFLAVPGETYFARLSGTNPETVVFDTV